MPRRDNKKAKKRYMEGLYLECHGIFPDYAMLLVECDSIRKYKFDFGSKICH